MTKILIVDDDAAVRDALSLVISRAGYEVATATNGIDALRLFADERPDIVITDIIMPDMEGIQTVRELRARDPHVKIVAISGGGRMKNTDVLDIARKFGAQEVLPKPFSNKELLEIIVKLLSSRSG